MSAVASALLNRQNCACARKTLQTQGGRTHSAGCMLQWFLTAEPLGERRYENWNTHTFVDHNILTPFQSGFTPGDSTVNQLTYLYNTLCNAFDSEKKVRVILFCDITKAFDRVWHAGLVHKLQASHAAGISGNLLHWFINYLSYRKQRVVLPGLRSVLEYHKAFSFFTV